MGVLGGENVVRSRRARLSAERRARLLAALFLGIALSVPWALARAQSAQATAPRPHVSGSYYINSASTATAESLGCTNGEYATNNGYNRQDILDFGGQVSGGAELVNGTTLTTSQIEAVAEQYAYGFYGCAGDGTLLHEAVATNNSVDEVSSAGGAIWANMVDTISSSSLGSASASQVTFMGGNDFEDWYSTTTATAAEAWAQGFDGATSKLYLNFGSADGCSTTGYSAGGGHGDTCDAANDLFGQHSYWYLSWGEPAAESAPEIYNTDMPKQWLEICLYGTYEESSEIYFTGPLSQNNSFTIADSWSYFWNDLNGTACAQTPTYEIEQVTE